MPITDRRIPITVLAGQSNANSTALAVEVFRATANAGGMMVHVAMNGSGLGATVPTPSGHWNARDADSAMGENLAILFRQLVSILDPASPSYVPGAYLDNVIFVQGEADAYNANAAGSYGANLRAFHAALTQRFGTHELVLAGLSDAPDNHSFFGGNHARNWDDIQRQQINVANDLTSVSIIDPDMVAARAGFSADDMFRGDWIHYDDDTGFAALLGRALANAAIEAGAAAIQAGAARPLVGTNGNDQFTLALTRFAQVLAGPGSDRVVMATNESLRVIEATEASTRIMSAFGTPPRILDLLRVESLQLGGGHDIVQLAGGVRYLLSGAGNDHVTGAPCAEYLSLGTGRDRAAGGRGGDFMLGGTGHDALWGQGGNDRLRGGPGDDTIWGGDGRDRISGNAGNDVLTGGAGADAFFFASNSGRDRITDFDADVDRISFADIAPRNVTLHQQGSDLIITTASTRLMIEDTSLSDLQKSDILFI